MKLHVEIDMDGAAFEEGLSHGNRASEVRTILLSLLRGRMDLGGEDESPLVDSNGNTCGRAWTTED